MQKLCLVNTEDTLCTQVAIHYYALTKRVCNCHKLFDVREFAQPKTKVQSSDVFSHAYKRCDGNEYRAIFGLRFLSTYYILDMHAGYQALINRMYDICFQVPYFLNLYRWCRCQVFSISVILYQLISFFVNIYLKTVNSHTNENNCQSTSTTTSTASSARLTEVWALFPPQRYVLYTYPCTIIQVSV